MIRRRFTASFAAFAVVASGLMFSAAPAPAVETITTNPSTYDPAQTITVRIDGFPNMVSGNGYIFWLDFQGMTGSGANTGSSTGTLGSQTDCLATTGVGFTRVSGTGTAVPNGQSIVGSTNGCEWISPTSFRFSYTGTAGLGNSSVVDVVFPIGAFTIPGSGQYGVNFTAGATKQFQLSYVCWGNCPTSGATDLPPVVTLNIDANGGRCYVSEVTGYQGTWTTAPDSRSCALPGSVFRGFNTKSDGSGLAIAPGGNLNLTTDNTLFAQYEATRIAGAPTNVVAQRGYQIVSVSWDAPTDPGSSAISAYLVRSKPEGRTCVVNTQTNNSLECVYDKGVLTPGVKYTFEVQALNSAGWGPMSAESNGATPFDVRFDTLSRPKAASFLFIGGGSTIEASGRAPGLSAGTTLTPHVQIGASGKWETETRNLPRVNADGTYSWSKKLARNVNGQAASVYFTFNDVKTRTLTAAVGASDGVPSAPRDLKVTSTTDGITVSWKAPSRNGGSPITNYIVKSDLRGFSCDIAAPATSCTQAKKPGVLHDPKKSYTFSVAAKTQRGTGPATETKWQGELYRLNFTRQQLNGSDFTLGFNAKGFSCSQKFEVQAKIGADGKWTKQPGAAVLDPETCSYGEWTGPFPKVADGTFVIYRLKSPNGLSSEWRAYT